MKFLLALMLPLFVCAPSLFAQTGTVQNEIPHIEVTGKAERLIVPDEIYLSITIKERESGRDQITIEQQEGDVKAALTRLNIPLESLTISDATADYVRVKWNRKDVVSQSEYELKLVEAQQVADVMEQLDSLKIKNAFISRVSHSEIEAMTKEIEIEAIQNAKEKADYLLEAIGESADAALVIRELSDVSYNEPAMLRANIGYSAYVHGSDLNKIMNKIEFKKIKLERTIYVKFSILQK